VLGANSLLIFHACEQPEACQAPDGTGILAAAPHGPSP
jgi:hypothetical protein